MPAKAGIQSRLILLVSLDPRVRGDDDGRVNGCEFARLEFLANFNSRARPNTLYGFQAEPLAEGAG